MHAVVTRVKIADREKAEGFLTEQLIPAVSQAPGFVTGHWANMGGDRGASMTVYESEEAAKQAMDQFDPPPADVVTIESMEVGEVVGQA
jgi:hypothetical protein